MEILTKDNAKISDSGYTTTCLSQSQRSSGSSFSKNSNRSESSGYCGGNPSAFGASNNALPRPISRGKKPKNNKSTTSTTTTTLAIGETTQGVQLAKGEQSKAGYNALGGSSDSIGHYKKSEEVTGVKLADATELGEHNGNSNSTDPEGGVGTNTNPSDDATSNINEGFAVVISLHNGLVVDATPSLKASLGYTRASWIGQSFIDFVHPKDKPTFADHLVKNIAVPCGDRVLDLSGRQTSLFCSLRKHEEARSSATGSGSDECNSVNAARSLFSPFHLTMSVKLFRGCTEEEIPRVLFLTIIVNPVIPVYRAPEETIISAIFSTRHDSNCILTHVDHEAVRYFGYLPQDMVGCSLFDFYHPEDLPFIKEVYETVVKMDGSPFRSKPYRFATQNGGYAVLETEWSSFINPWRNKIEFVVGHHRVLRGPSNPDVFRQPDDCQRSLLASISEEVIKESKIIWGEICALLNEKIRRTEDLDVYSLSRTSKDLTAFVENLLQEVKPPAPLFKHRAPTDDKNLLERGSVILGAISPHHEYCDSKSSTETPPSYNQLNYNEKLERFFNSQPLVNATFGSIEENINSNDEISKSSQNLTGTKDTTPNGSGACENISSSSINRTSSDSRDDSDNARSANMMPHASFKHLTLTESLMNKHNIDMEELMAKQHKQRRFEIKNNNEQLIKSKIEGSPKEPKARVEQRRRGQNGKRCKSPSRSGPLCKISKLEVPGKTCPAKTVPVSANGAAEVPKIVDDPSPPHTQSSPTMNIYSSGTVTVPSQQTPHLCVPAQNIHSVGLQEASRCQSSPSMMPIYYLPVPRPSDVFLNPMSHAVSDNFMGNGPVQQNPYVPYVTAPLAGIIYPPMVWAPSPVSSMYRTFVVPASAPILRETSPSNSAIRRQENSPDRKRPASQATSVKAEPGSIMAMSESSKKVLSPAEQFSSCVSIDGGCLSLVDLQTTASTKRKPNSNSQVESRMEDSSDSSFYGSFLPSSSGSSCLQPRNAASTSRELPWKPTRIEKEQYEMLRKGPPWKESVRISDELTYQYQLKPKPLSEILNADKKALERLNQPKLVNAQLAQLYSDMELGGCETKRLLSDIDSSSENISEDNRGNARGNMPEHLRVRREMEHSTMAMIYEENAPLPSP